MITPIAFGSIIIAKKDAFVGVYIEFSPILLVVVNVDSRSKNSKLGDSWFDTSK